MINKVNKRGIKDWILRQKEYEAKFSSIGFDGSVIFFCGRWSKWNGCSSLFLSNRKIKVCIAVFLWKGKFFPDLPCWQGEPRSPQSPLEPGSSFFALGPARPFTHFLWPPCLNRGQVTFHSSFKGFPKLVAQWWVGPWDTRVIPLKVSLQLLCAGQHFRMKSTAMWPKKGRVCRTHQHCF